MGARPPPPEQATAMDDQPNPVLTVRMVDGTELTVRTIPRANVTQLITDWQAGTQAVLQFDLEYEDTPPETMWIASHHIIFMSTTND
jgi:hypothetical protein